MTPTPPPLTAIILTLNEERHLPGCLDSLHTLAPCLVFDSFSTDSTLAIARAHGAAVVQHKFENYSRQRNAALAAVSTEWVLFVDADECVPAALAAEIRAVLNDATRPEAAWWIPRDNVICGHTMRGAGWSPDPQLRLLRRTRARYAPERAVHEVAEIAGPIGTLTQRLLHYNYDTIGEFMAKQARYTTDEAHTRFAEGLRPQAHQPFIQPLRHFWWRFVTLHGYRDGWHGLRLSALMAYYHWQMYRQLARLIRAAPP